MWIYEKFYSWTDNNGSPEDSLSRNQMLDDISLHWFTNTAASSAQIYCSITLMGQTTSATVAMLLRVRAQVNGNHNRGHASLKSTRGRAGMTAAGSPYPMLQRKFDFTCPSGTNPCC